MNPLFRLSVVGFIMMAMSPSASAEGRAVVEAIRIDAVTLPMLQNRTPDNRAKGAAQDGLKPAPMPRIPGPMLSLHRHADSEGSAAAYCREDHSRIQIPALLPVPAEHGL